MGRDSETAMIERDSDRMRPAYPGSLLAPLIAIAAMAVLWGVAGGLRPWAGSILLIAGLASWTLVEYLLHRFVLHGRGPFQRWHEEHHRRPEVPMRTPLAFSLMLLLGLVLLPGLLIGDIAVGAAFSGGLILGHVLQEAVHHRLHQSVPRAGGWLARRQRQHLRHHNEDETLAFGTLTGVWDCVFGTDRRHPG